MWLIFWILFWLTESWYFGWNREPSCLTEHICDGIATAMITINMLIRIDYNFLREAFCNLTGMRYHYVVMLKYYPTRSYGGWVISNIGHVQLKSKHKILNTKEVKRYFQPWVKAVAEKPDSRKNGQFEIEIQCYLGLFKKERKS